VYPFGHGLSYASFEYSPPAVTVREQTPGALTVVADLTVANTSGVPGHEIVQLYARRVANPDLDSDLDSEREALRILVDFERVFLDAGESRQVTFEVPQERLEQWSVEKATRFLPAGEYEFEIARSSADPVVGSRLELS